MINSDIALETVSLSKNYGSLAVTRDVSIRLERGARHALIGPNGAGKSTLIHQLTGVLRPDDGRVMLNGLDVTDHSVEQRVKLGLSRTFQINTLFKEFTPLESVTLAILERTGTAGKLFASARRESAAIDEAISIVRSIGLSDKDARRRVADLPYGRQRMVEIALALASKPKVLLLDEPAAGIPADESADIFNVIANLPEDVAVLFVEHDMELVFRFAKKITVLVSGALFFEGSPEAVAASDEVRKIYLGDKSHV
ncbi:branched-chain amino acid ABC transporter ATP-binding protein [Pusillimonas sp. T2]|uniref:ABC transporter ATP-binding protein n=1 Tax=Pusillimonas sp. T2 TaxID=1548123 RepID=UPI000B9466EE|nr:ABC transporter ATP-binding protein [Pusillimonas sp. T2]OXR49475.1 branched-chain amino acid ABC transporter ATP-binding protein [Pusillimonas sp. T2]